MDLKHGVMHRRGSGQRVTKKLQPTIPIPRQLLGHMRRWAKAGGRWVVTDRGARIGDIKTAWNRASEVAGMPEVTPHTLRHTAITWAMQRGARLADAVSYFGVSAPSSSWSIGTTTRTTKRARSRRWKGGAETVRSHSLQSFGGYEW